jgi:hypothetical protein
MPKLKIRLTSCGNPDMGQDPNNPKYGCEPNRWQPVKDLKEAREVFCAYVRDNQLGAGNIGTKCGQVVTETGKEVASISPNGRVWDSWEGMCDLSAKEILV